MPNKPVPDALESALSIAAAIDFCDQALDASELAEMLNAGRPFNRKALCTYLGIGESTLSGWLKEGRIPQMAKNAIVLLLAQRQLAGNLQRLQALDWKVVRTGDGYQVCEISEGDGQTTGRVVANDINSVEDARLAASGPRLLRLLDRILNSSGIFDYVIEQSENECFLDDTQDLRKLCRSELLFLTDHAKWQEQRRLAQSTLDDLIASVSADAQPPSQRPQS